MKQPTGRRTRAVATARRKLVELPYAATFEVCESCGRTLLTGEKSTRLWRDGEALSACPLCAGALLTGGFQRAA
jgi:RNase P subunit RPR2